MLGLVWQETFPISKRGEKEFSNPPLTDFDVIKWQRNLPGDMALGKGMTRVVVDWLPVLLAPPFERG